MKTRFYRKQTSVADHQRHMRTRLSDEDRSSPRRFDGKQSCSYLGVGGIEAEAVMLGQAVSMVLPKVVGYKLIGQLNSLATSTDVVLTITKHLRQIGVVGKFVEFFGPGLSQLSHRGPGDHSEHVSGVWCDRRLLCRGRDEHEVSPTDWSRRGTDSVH